MAFFVIEDLFKSSFLATSSQVRNFGLKPLTSADRCPEFLLAPFTHEAIQEYIETNIAGFDDQEIPIQISYGGAIRTTISVNVFRPSTSSTAQTGYHPRDGEYGVEVESLPIGLFGNDNMVSENDYSRQLELSLTTLAFLPYASGLHSSTLSTIFINAVFQYYKSMQVVSAINS